VAAASELIAKDDANVVCVGIEADNLTFVVNPGIKTFAFDTATDCPNVGAVPATDTEYKNAI
jgi:hypothetical protein